METSNVFRFVLKEGDTLLYEKIFDADSYKLTRYSVDIRKLLSPAIVKLQKVLSRASYDTVYELGSNIHDLSLQGLDETSDKFIDYGYYDLYDYYDYQLSLYPQRIRKDMEYFPETVTKQIDKDKKIVGVECKMGFYSNNNKIVERLFYVNNFNPVAKFSIDLTDVCNGITDDIIENIYQRDIENIYSMYESTRNYN